jgi:myosin protein heavy chain
LNIEEVNLRNNIISDDGVRALGAVLSGKNALKLVDLKGNKISKNGIKVLAEALERNERVKHVYVHAGGKIEALGTSRWAHARDGNGATAAGSTGGSTNKNLISGNVETICVVDVRDNNPETAEQPYALRTLDMPGTNALTSSMQSAVGFKPNQLLDPTNVPGANTLQSSSNSPMRLQKGASKKGSKTPTRSSMDATPVNSNPNDKQQMTEQDRKKLKMKVFAFLSCINVT